MNTNKNNSAWFNEDILPNEMIKGVSGEKWPKLEYAEHFGVLKTIMESLIVSKMADMGCGAAELGRVTPNINYTGFDLPHIIDKVSKVVNPKLNYVYYNADNFDYSVLKEYDLIVCNSFISELHNPIDVLSYIIKNTTKYLLIHRQYFSEETNFSNYTTYGNLPTIRSYVGFDDFKNLLNNHKIVQHKKNDWGDTVLIEKIS